MNFTRRSILGAIGLMASASAFAHGRRHPGPGAMDDERIERFIKHLAVEVDATAEQQRKLTEIAKAAAHDLAPLRSQSLELRKQGLALFTAASVDKNAVEQLRLKRMQNADAISKRMTRALTDSADVLTPEQRRKAAERAARWRHFG
jgi:Spy/CpxP family protein refolding chaperone